MSAFEKANWISDASYSFTEKKISPIPMQFQKELKLNGIVKKSTLRISAFGIYEVFVDGNRVGDRYFAPGFTSYKHQMQYQKLDLTEYLKNEKATITVVVAGGWAVGSFVFTRKNRIVADRQALIASLEIDYEDGNKEYVNTDENWQVSEDGPFRYADFYDGEEYDANKSLIASTTRNATIEKLKFVPNLLKEYGAPVVCKQVLEPVEKTIVSNEVTRFDFGQNFAGVVEIELNGQKGQRIEITHAEVLKNDGSLNRDFLRTAKATSVYYCKDGRQTYSPRFTYMGFRYIEVYGIKAEDFTVRAKVLYSDIEEIGEFSCSNEMLNRLQQNIKWGAKSNFVDIPTDCPQRDERMGWTGDIAVFSKTACFNFDMSKFLKKWLKDLKAEQLKTGGIPNTIPSNGFGFPATMPTMAVDWWDDAVLMVPFAIYDATGDKSLIKEMYPSMKRYVDAARFWAGFGLGKHKYIWNTPSVLHFGDWVAPDVPKMSQWQGRAPLTATASLFNTSTLLARAAEICGYESDRKKYSQYATKVADAYIDVFTDGKGRLKNEFQTAYALPIYLGIFEGAMKQAAADRLAELVAQNDYKIGTGFPGTPYILFALSDNGHADVAYKMLLNTKCPSWLYEVKQGATTIWERWDGLDENGDCPIGDDGTDIMISYNHYASGAVGDFLYRRVAGIEPMDPGYIRFKVKPVIDKSLTWAKAHTDTPRGRVAVEWKIKENVFTIKVTVPTESTANVELPDGTRHDIGTGTHELTCRL